MPSAKGRSRGAPGDIRHEAVEVHGRPRPGHAPHGGDIAPSAGALWAALDLVTDGLAVLDADGLVVYANEALKRLARTRSGLGGSPFLALFRTGACDPLPAWPLTGACTFEGQLTPFTGHSVPVRVQIRRLPAAAGPGPTYAAVLTPRALELSFHRVLERSAQDVQRLSHQVLTVQETERKRIAADLHDSLGQSLSAVKFGLETVSAALSLKNLDEARNTMSSVVSTVKDALGDVRRLAMNLRPSMLDDLGVLSTLSWFAREFRGIYRGIEVQTRFDVCETDIDDRLKVAIFRVVQEAMNNVAKHSRASAVHVSLALRGDVLHLDIQDNGVGFDPREVDGREGEARRHGHACARDRVEWTGGAFSIRTAPGDGVRITAEWDRLPCAGAGPQSNKMPNKGGAPAAVSLEAHHGSGTDLDRRRPHAASHGLAGPSLAER